MEPPLLTSRPPEVLGDSVTVLLGGIGRAFVVVEEAPEVCGREALEVCGGEVLEVCGREVVVVVP